MKVKTRSLWGKPPLRTGYDTVIIGGGIHGLATAYFLARDHGMTDTAVIERRYVGCGGTGRNTAIVRANQRSRENLRLYDEGLKLRPKLIAELDFNMMFFNWTPRVLIATGGYGTQTAGLLGLRPAGEEVFTRRLEYWATGKCNGD